MREKRPFLISTVSFGCFIVAAVVGCSSDFDFYSGPRAAAGSAGTAGSVATAGGGGTAGSAGSTSGGGTASGGTANEGVAGESTGSDDENAAGATSNPGAGGIGGSAEE